MHRIVIAAALAALLAACQSTPTSQEAAPVEDRAATAAGAGTSGASTSGAGTSGVAGTSAGASRTTAAGANPLKDPANVLSKRSVHFDFDSFAVKDEYKPLVEAHGRYLAGNRNARTTVQGNTDERGSREYNIALGQKRADAVKRMLMLMGAQESQIETVSFGKEKPRNPGHDEAAWAENRRVDIVYAGE